MPIVYPFPPELRKSAYISRAEENRMDVELIATVQFREKYGFEVTSDPPEIPAEIEHGHSDDENWSSDDHSEELTVGRKRAFSLLSQASSTASRRPPLDKLIRL